MGFLKGLFGEKASADPLLALRQKVEDQPKEGRFAQDLSQQLKAAGRVSEAVEFALRSAQAYRARGFLQKGAAVLKSTLAWAAPTPELLEALAALQLELTHKEDAREALVQLRQLYRAAGRHAEEEQTAARLAELGPGR